MEQRIVCECGCGTQMARFDNRGRLRRFVRFHQSRMRTAAKALAAAATLARVRPKGGWNKGQTYLIAKRTVYANKGAWTKALLRLYGNVCMRCGWSEARCDGHHIILKSQGGKFTIENGIILCPNCHRVSHSDVTIQQSLIALKGKATPLCRSY